MSKSLVASLPCNLCGAIGATVVGTRSRSGAPLRSVCCVDCGLVRSDPRPVESRRFYEHDYRLSYKGTLEPKIKHVLRAGQVALDRLAHVRPLLQQRRRVLDVGSGGGEFSRSPCVLLQPGHASANGREGGTAGGPGHAIRGRWEYHCTAESSLEAARRPCDAADPRGARPDRRHPARASAAAPSAHRTSLSSPCRTRCSVDA